MKNISSILLAFLFVITGLQISEAATRRYRLVWNDDPATTMGFALEQYDNGVGTMLSAVVYYGTSPSTMTNTLTAIRTENERGMDNVFFKATNLSPNTVYYFYIEDGQTTSQTYYFETAPNDPSQRLSLIAGGDSRAAFNGGDQSARQNANKLVAKLRPHAILFGGDFTNLDTNGEWQTWFDDWQLTIASDGRMTPIIPARGNHELTDGSRVYDLFNTPSAGSGVGDTYYALNMGGDLLRIYTLNSLISVTGEQATWLNGDLSTACNTWKIAQYHYPIRPHNSGKDEQDDQRSAWCPAFENHGLNLAIESDSHLNKYTHPIKMSTATGSEEGFIRDDQDGVVYIGEGGWGATLRSADDAKAWTFDDSGNTPFNQIKLLFIDQNSIDVRTVITKNGDANYPDNITELPLSDRFTLPSNLDLWQPVPASAATGILSFDASNSVMSLNNPTTTNLSVDLGADVPVSAGTTMVLDAGAGFDNYLWSTGETTQTITIDLTNPAAYSVTASTNGCIVQDALYVYGSQAIVGKTYEVDGDNLYISECGDCTFGPDPYFFVRVNDNQDPTWENWNKDFSNSDCEWLGMTNFSWLENRPANASTVFTIELDAYEDDDFLCGGDDGSCGGYQAIASHTICDLPPCDWHYFQAFRDCTSDGSTITWGVEYSYRYTYDDLDPGSISTADVGFCGTSFDPSQITSLIDATDYATYQWEQSADETNWTNVLTNGNTTTYDPAPITQTTYYRRRVNDCSGRERYSNVIALTLESPSTPFTEVLDSTALIVCEGNMTTLEVTGGTDGSGTTTEWYTDALLTNLVATGAVFPTPILSANATYFVVRRNTCGVTMPLIVDVTIIPDYLVVTDNPSAGLYQAGIQVATSGTVVVDNDATYKGGVEVCLNSGFEVQLGATFLGTIEDCSGSTTSSIVPTYLIEKDENDNQ